MNIGRIITIFIIIQIFAGVVYTISLYQREKAAFYPYEPVNYYATEFSYVRVVLLWQLNVSLGGLFRGDIIGLIMIVASLGFILFFIWVAYIIDKKMFAK